MSDGMEITSPVAASAENGFAAEAEEGAAMSAATPEKNEKSPWHRRREFRLLFLLLLVGGIAGLAAGLATRNRGAADGGELSSAAADGGVEGGATEEAAQGGSVDPPVEEVPSPGLPPPAPSPAPTAPETAMPWVDDEVVGETDPPVFSPLTPVVADRSCEYQYGQTVPVSAPGYVPVNGNITVEKKLSGGASAFDGDNAVIVSYNRDGTAGAVWALSKGGDGASYWEQSGVFQTNDADQLGWGVAIEGNTIVVGAPGQDGRDIGLIEGWYWAGRGVAMVVAKDEEANEETGEEEDGASPWYQQAILSPAVAADNAAFGSSVAIAECQCLISVGAWHDRDSRGSAYVFAKNRTGGWTEIQKLAPTDTRRSQSDHLHGNYGYTVAMNDDYLAVKAPYDSYTNSKDWYDPNRGIVYVYKRGHDGLYARVERLHAPEGKQVRTHLKDMIFLDNFLLVGAPGRNKVYVFERTSSMIGETDGGNGDGYKKTAELTPSDGAGPESYFGVSLDGKGTDVLVGNRGNKTSYLFSYEDGAWKEKAKFNGLNAALSGGTIVEHIPVTFDMMDGERYRGEVSFYDLVCEEE